jgi:hypothetical protein|tara:strand:- start:482 stop:685 length:204 start_codon:yes stop_codon:yes gene_type:complete
MSEQEYEIIISNDGTMEVNLLSGFPEGTEAGDVVADLVEGIAEVTRVSHKGGEHTHETTSDTVRVSG